MKVPLCRGGAAQAKDPTCPPWHGLISSYLKYSCLCVQQTQVASERGVVLIQRVRNRLYHLLLRLLGLRLQSLGQLDVGQHLRTEQENRT